MPAIAYDLSPSGSGSLAAPFQVFLGGTLFLGFSLAVDYQGSNAYLEAGGHPAIPADIPATALGAPIQLPFELRGGGVASFPGCGAGCQVPATRVVVPVVVEGRQPVSMLVDTGVTFVVLDTAVASSLPDAGRPRLDGVRISTISGPETTYLTRLASISVGGSGDVSEPVLVLPAGTTTLTELSQKRA